MEDYFTENILRYFSLSSCQTLSQIWLLLKVGKTIIMQLYAQ